MPTINIPARSQPQRLGTLAPNQTIPQNDISRSPTPVPDPGDPIAVLNNKGITEVNKTNLSALVAALETFGDFKRGTSWNIGKEGATQLIAITRLLREASLLYGDQRLATNEDLKQAVSDIKEAVSPGHVHPSGPTMNSYAAAAKRGIGTSSNQATLQKKKMIAELQQKQIFVSMKNVAKDAPILKWEPAILTRYCSDILTNFFKEHPDNEMSIPLPLRGITKSAAGNVTLTFKNIEDANKARVQADKWVKIIDPAATTPQRSYAVVAHNASTELWTDTEDLKDAIDNLEAYNMDNTPDGRQIANLAWLNSAENRKKIKRGPLMISYRTKAAANAAIENGLIIEGTLCSVSLYIPRPPQCFRCQDWGHRATGCIGEPRCGKCAGPHTTTDHICTHEQPCPTGQKCTAEKSRCSNCQGEHPSWTRTCPVAKAAIETETQKNEYATGKYEAYTPFTFADIEYTPGRRTFTQPRTPSPRPSQPQINYIPATSPLGPNV
jgi:hypothetical protein